MPYINESDPSAIKNISCTNNIKIKIRKQEEKLKSTLLSRSPVADKNIKFRKVGLENCQKSTTNRNSMNFM